MRHALAVALVLGGCASGAVFADEDTPSPQAVADAYLVARGMAVSYAERPDADPAIVGELARLDARALEGLHRLGRDGPGARKAVSAFADFAAHQSSATR